MLRRFGLLAALIACAASTANAQEIVFAGIPWGAPADSVRARLRTLGYAHRGATPTGDHSFARADDAQVLVMLRNGRMVGIYVTDPARGARADARYRVLADSLEAVFGAPLDRRPESRRWETGIASVAVRVASDRESGARGVITDWTGPGWFDEMRRRGSFGNLAALPAGYTTVSVLGGVALSVDTAHIVPQNEGLLLLGRFRIDYPQPVDHPTGRYDALEYAMQFDCARGLARMLERSPFLGGVRGPSFSEADLPPTRAHPGTDAWSGLDAVCRAGGRGAELAALRQSFTAPPAGWVLASERGGMRWLVDSASVRAKSAGVYEAVMRAESGEARSIPGGRMDAVRMRVEADCAGTRWRVTAMTALFQGREVSPVPVPPEQAAWMDGNSNPVLETVCRIATQRRP
jgi:hypothetical protein